MKKEVSHSSESSYSEDSHENNAGAAQKSKNYFF